MLLLVRARSGDDRSETAPFTGVGRAVDEGHRGRQPMQIVRRLDRAVPGWVIVKGRAVA